VKIIVRVTFSVRVQSVVQISVRIRTGVTVSVSVRLVRLALGL
jgi:hypothetical protein